jgi:hypothetical protein
VAHRGDPASDELARLAADTLIAPRP